MNCRMHFWVLLCLLGINLSAVAEAEDELGLWIIEKSNNASLNNKSVQNMLKVDDVLLTGQRKVLIKNYQEALRVRLDSNKMKAILSQVTSANLSKKQVSEGSGNQHPITISIPLPDGSITVVALAPEQVLTGTLADSFPHIRTYNVLGNEKVFAGKVDITPMGFHAMLQMLDGEIIFVDPVNILQDGYVSYKKSAQKQSIDRAFSCGVSNTVDHLKESFGEQELDSVSSKLIARKAPGNLRHYKIAIATTGEYAAKHGGTIQGVMSAITTTINRVNQVLERDIGIHLDIVENNNLLINLDANTDPFTKTDMLELLGQNQAYIDSVIGYENYDLGHLFSGSGGGIAAIASVCNQYRKAQGISGTSNPVNDSFDLDFVAHEIGHQLGASHTFNSSQGLCSGNTRSAITAFEPGSGSSIMSYAGYCGLDNLQSNTDAMYHIGSIKQISDFTSNGRGNRCGTKQILSNKPPTVDAGDDFVIPSRTPFELKGTATDAENDALIYAWEQIDSGETSLEFDDKGDNALFRVHLPQSNPVRMFPPLKDILSHSSTKGEKLPEHQRSLNFSFVAQDGINVAQSDEMKIDVVRTGSRFALNLPKSQYTTGKSYQILWNVADTHKAPVSCQSVDLFLSIDSGSTFPITLVENLPNSGEAWVILPVTVENTAKGRFKLKCSNNVFFALSYRDFVITDKSTQVTYKHIDEDQLEVNLEDTDLSVVAENNESNSPTSDVISPSSGGSGGGLFDGWLMLFGCLLLISRRYHCYGHFR